MRIKLVNQAEKYDQNHRCSVNQDVFSLDTYRQTSRLRTIIDLTSPA
jgi:hypothetical protein